MNNFEYRTIDELIEDNCNFYRQQKEFTLTELSQYDGGNGKPAYVAIEGIVYDISNEPALREVKDIGIIAGKDLTEQFNFYSRINKIINETPRIGILNNDCNIDFEINRAACKQEKQSRCQLNKGQWGDCNEYIEKEAMARRNKKVTKENCNCQKYITSNMLVELEAVLQETINKVLELQIKMLKCAGTTTAIKATTQEIETGGSIGAKSSGAGVSADGFLLVGGALGGAGGGLGVASKSTEKLGGSEGMSQGTAGTGVKLGPGATGGATGGALGVPVGTSSAGGTVGGLGGTTGRNETIDDIKRDRLDIED